MIAAELTRWDWAEMNGDAVPDVVIDFTYHIVAPTSAPESEADSEPESLENRRMPRHRGKLEFMGSGKGFAPTAASRALMQLLWK
jgi:hypothetical protein